MSTSEGGDEERCIAITNSGNRCSRIAKDGQFCFQHDESDETIDIVRSEDAGIVNWLSSELEMRAATASDVRRDVYLNLVDAQDGLRNTIDDFKSGNTSMGTLLDRFNETANEVGGERSQRTAKGGIIGGIAGVPLGPLGIWAGMVTGSTIGFATSKKDDRAVIGFLVEDVPEDAKIVPSSHEAIADVTPIQVVVESVVEGEDEDWVRETNTRAWDMDAVEAALSEIPEYEADEAPPGGYYIRDNESGEVIVLVFGEPEDDFEMK
jgi:hypothetical protein